MNKERRNRIHDVIENLEKIKNPLCLLAAWDIVSSVYDQENTAFSQMPEGVKNGKRGKASLEAMHSLSYVEHLLDKYVDYFDHGGFTEKTIKDLERDAEIAIDILSKI